LQSQYVPSGQTKFDGIINAGETAY